MGRITNNLLGIVNFITLLISIVIIGSGIGLARHSSLYGCFKSLQAPIIAIGILLLLVSLAGLIGACFRNTWLLWFYLFFMCGLSLVILGYTIFAFIVTGEGSGRALSNRAYKEYRLGDYSDWLQKKIGSQKHWGKFRSCLIGMPACQSMSNVTDVPDRNDFDKRDWDAIQSGCCKPDDDCNFGYVSPTVWTKPDFINSTKPDCALWDNNNYTLCYNCSSCKAALINTVKLAGRDVAITNIFVLVALVFMYCLGWYAFRKTATDDDGHKEFP